jgi:hypothetical protein
MTYLRPSEPIIAKSAGKDTNSGKTFEDMRKLILVAEPNSSARMDMRRHERSSEPTHKGISREIEPV